MKKFSKWLSVNKNEEFLNGALKFLGIRSPQKSRKQYEGMKHMYLNGPSKPPTILMGGGRPMIIPSSDRDLVVKMINAIQEGEFSPLEMKIEKDFWLNRASELAQERKNHRMTHRRGGTGISTRQFQAEDFAAEFAKRLNQG